MPAARDVVVVTNNTSSVNFNLPITVGLGATLCVVEITGVPGAMSTNAAATRITSVTIGGGGAFTLLYADPGSGGVIAGEVWGYLSPPNGAQTIVVQRNASGFSPVSVCAKTYTGTDNSSFAAAMSAVTRQTCNSGASTTTYTLNIASGANDITESCVCAGSVHTAVVASAGAAQTQDATQTDGNSAEFRAGWAAGTGGTVAHTWDMTADVAGRLAYGFYFSVKEGAGGGGGSNPAGIQACLAGESKLVGGRMAV